MKETELREKLLMMLPTLRRPTFLVIQAQFNDRLKRGVLDRTLRHMVQEGLVQKTTSQPGAHTVKHYLLTQDGLTERARLVLSERRKAC